MSTIDGYGYSFGAPTAASGRSGVLHTVFGTPTAARGRSGNRKCFRHMGPGIDPSETYVYLYRHTTYMSHIDVLRSPTTVNVYWLAYDDNVGDN